MTLERHAALTADIATSCRVLGDTRAAAINRSHDVWQQTSHLGVTERREEVRQACADLHALIAEQEGELDALRAELRHVELLLDT